MMVKNKKCKHCGEEFKLYNSLQKFCSVRCMKLGKGYKQIKKVSAKREMEDKIYHQLRKTFLSKPENKFCPVFKLMKGVDIRTTDCHHMRGRTGKLFLDTKYWLAVSREGHMYIEENPEWAKEHGFSLDRL